ncbi:MAG: CPBP family intramembrane metalloprotease [Candidatus Marsarchaeota archaeon]|nr:CPBP family intramembrane metalloprotease [Candidatus Marsarchaeota archaeon]
MKIGFHAENAAILNLKIIKNNLNRCSILNKKPKLSKPMSKIKTKKELKIFNQDLNYNKKIKYITYLLLILSFISLLYFLYLSSFTISQLLLYNYLNSNSTIVLSLIFPLIVFSYLLHKTNNLDFIIQNLGISRDKLTLKNIFLGLALFIVMLVGVELSLSLFSQITHIPLPTNVKQLLEGYPIFFYLFTFLIAPINEEIMFRGFLVSRIGIIPSALIFALFHFGYFSVSEFIAALIFGLIAGYLFKKTKSLYVSITAHMLLNFLTVFILFLI